MAPYEVAALVAVLVLVLVTTVTLVLELDEELEDDESSVDELLEGLLEDGDVVLDEVDTVITV